MNGAFVLSFLELALLSTTFFLFVSAEEAQKPKDQTGELLNNLRLTHWDDWDANVSCPHGLFMTGLGLRHGLEEVMGKNVTVVTGFELICSDRLSTRNKLYRSITFGKGGEWGNRTECRSGFAMGISPSLSTSTSFIQSSSHVLSIKLYCSDNPKEALGRTAIRQENALQSQDFEHTLDYEQFCESGEAISGISINADSVITFYKGDSTSVKLIGMECAKVPNPATFCIIKFRWEPRPGIKCSQPSAIKASKTDGGAGSYSKVNCTFQTWIGIGPNENRADNVTQAILSYASLGRNNEESFVKRAILMKLRRPEIMKWFSVKFPHNPGALEEFMIQQSRKTYQNVTVDIDHQYKNHIIPNQLFRKIRGQIDIHHEPFLQQLVGHCSIYKIAFNLFLTKHHASFYMPIKKRLTKIIFEN